MHRWDRGDSAGRQQRPPTHSPPQLSCSGCGQHLGSEILQVSPTLPPAAWKDITACTFSPLSATCAQGLQASDLSMQEVWQPPTRQPSSSTLLSPTRAELLAEGILYKLCIWRQAHMPILEYVAFQNFQACNTLALVSKKHMCDAASAASQHQHRAPHQLPDRCGCSCGTPCERGACRRRSRTGPAQRSPRCPTTRPP